MGLGIGEEAPASPGLVRRVLIGRNPKVTLARILILIVVSFVLFRFVFLAIRVEGISMLPTFANKGVHLVNRLAYRFREPQRGDVVAIKLADEGVKNPQVMYLKRIVGLPGESIGFHDGRAVINGQMLDEPYIKFPSNWEHEPEQVEANEFYVVGDNRSMNFYDHEQGRAPRWKIVGKLIL